MTYDLGRHTYYVCARDHRGRGDCSPRQSFFVRADGQKPVVTTHYIPDRPAIGGNVDIEATANDPSGITEMTITVGALARSYECPLTPGAQNVDCRFSFPIPSGTQIFYYRVHAEDAEGLRTTTPPLAIVIGPNRSRWWSTSIGITTSGGIAAFFIKND